MLCRAGVWKGDVVVLRRKGGSKQALPHPEAQIPQLQQPIQQVLGVLLLWWAQAVPAVQTPHTEVSANPAAQISPGVTFLTPPLNPCLGHVTPSPTPS